MKYQEAKEWVDRIDAMKRDDEGAHYERDRLWKAVLTAITNGDTNNPAALAGMALRTEQIDFSRWYA